PLEGIKEIAAVVAPIRRLAISADDEDNRILECAEAAQADFLVTGNARHFPASLDNTRIINARNFLTRLGL
ncbi:MAG: PIN domain-containing protein, partial [Bryobacteraceae bacterium]